MGRGRLWKYLHIYVSLFEKLNFNSDYRDLARLSLLSMKTKMRLMAMAIRYE